MNAGFVFDDAGARAGPEAPWDLRGALGAADTGGAGRPRAVAFGAAASARVRRRAGGFSSGEEGSSGEEDSGALLPGEEALSDGSEGDELPVEDSDEDVAGPPDSDSGSGTEASSEGGDGSDSEGKEGGGSLPRRRTGRASAQRISHPCISLGRSCAPVLLSATPGPLPSRYAPPLPPLSPFLPCPRRVVVSGVQILDGRLYRACDDIGFPFVSLTRARIMNEVDHFTADATEPPVLRLFRCSQ